jgi:hypothetical protein
VHGGISSRAITDGSSLGAPATDRRYLLIPFGARKRQPRPKPRLMCEVEAPRLAAGPAEGRAPPRGIRRDSFHGSENGCLDGRGLTALNSGENRWSARQVLEGLYPSHLIWVRLFEPLQFM